MVARSESSSPPPEVVKTNELVEQRAHWYQSEGMALLGPSPTGDREHLFWAYGQRIVALGRGMARLQFPSFSPLVASGTRNALELLVEVLLLRHSPADFRAQERILSWSESARLKAAESGLSDRPSDGLAGAWREYVAAHASDVAQARGASGTGSTRIAGLEEVSRRTVTKSIGYLVARRSVPHTTFGCAS